MKLDIPASKKTQLRMDVRCFGGTTIYGIQVVGLQEETLICSSQFLDLQGRNSGSD
jgi:hypothetical protein